VSSTAYAEAEATGVVRGFEVLAPCVELPSARVPTDELLPLFKRLETVLFPLVSANSRTEFKALRQQLFHRYVVLMAAITEIAAEVRGIDEANCDWVTDLTTKVQEDEVLPWVESGKSEAIFSVETLARAVWLASEIIGMPSPEDDPHKKKDREFAAKYGLSAFWSQFHVDCLTAALFRRVGPPSAAILDEILEGMRLSVMAYAAAREGYDIRSVHPQPENYPDDVWDAEDEASVASSSRFGLERV
jgi:hypothetical protein